jgi:hypothetical protein
LAILRFTSVPVGKFYVESSLTNSCPFSVVVVYGTVDSINLDLKETGCGACERERLRWVRMEIREMGWEVVEWIHLALINTVMNIRFHERRGIC